MWNEAWRFSRMEHGHDRRKRCAPALRAAWRFMNHADTGAMSGCITIEADAPRHILPVTSDEQIVRLRQYVRERAVEQGFSLVDQTKLVTAASELAVRAAPARFAEPQLSAGGGAVPSVLPRSRQSRRAPPGGIAPVPGQPARRSADSVDMITATIAHRAGRPSRRTDRVDYAASRGR